MLVSGHRASLLRFGELLSGWIGDVIDAMSALVIHQHTRDFEP